MDDGRSVHTNHTRATAHWEIEPHKIPLPPSILDDNVDRRNDLEKIDKPTEPKEPKELQHRNVDDDTRFWQTYVSEAGKFDKELIESWNDNLDSLLLFAALFSAINTAFIIESYKRLQPDGTDSTNLLLRLILEHRNDNEPIPDENLTNGHWRPDSGAVRVNATLFASLACSLLASFGAILGKEMLAEYKSSGALSTLPEQGRTRQRKYDGLKRFRFRLLMQLLPIMLQLSLGLFLMGIIDFLWQMSIEVAIVILVPVVVGLIAYVVSVAVAIRWEDSPFQTSLSKSLRLLFPNVKKILRSFKKSAHNIQAFVVTQPPIMWNHIRRQAQSVKDIHSSLLTSPRWLAVSSKLDPITQIFYRSGITRIVKQILGNIIIISHICRLGVVGWWKQLDIKVWMTVYICGLGVVGWFAVVWEFLVSRMGLSAGKTGERPQEDTTTDVISGDCAVWLLENSQDTEVLHKALETLPLLPADIILKRFKTQPKILERYVLLYKSTLQRRPGDVDFRLDGVRMKDAIVAGTALFHVLKSRQEEDWGNDRWILFGADPELFDAVEDVERLAKLDFSLLTVFLCVQTQSGMGGVETWDFNLLHALLERFLATMRSKSLMMEPINISAPKSDPNSLSPTTPSITLLLDAGIFMVSQKYFQMPEWKLLHMCSYELESILVTIHSILEEHPTSMTLTSHVALLIAAVQWFKRKTETTSTVEGKELEFNGVKLSQLRKAWFAVDKRAEFFDNIILAFNLVGSLDTAATVNIYLDLLRLTEHFMPKVMEISWKHAGWRKWWSKVVLIIPGLLRLQREVDVHDHPEASQTVVRIIARLLPDDWFYEYAANEISKSENAPIQVISPRHPEHGSDMIGLISSALSSFGTLASPKTRKSVAEVLGWMIICPGVVGDLPLLLDNPSGMYQQFTTVPTLLMSFLVDSDTHYPLHTHHYKHLLRMTPQGQLGSRVQLEALVLALAHIPEHLSIFEAIPTLLNRMVVSEENFQWPVSFLEPKLVDWVSQGEGTSQRRVLQLQIIGESWEFLYSQLTQVWSGEALMMIWRKLSNQEHFDAMDFQYMLTEKTILTVLNSLEVAVMLNHQISYQTMDDYLEKVLDLGWVGAVLKERIDRAKALIKVAIAEGWETLVLRQISEKEAENDQAPEPPAPEPPAPEPSAPEPSAPEPSTPEPSAPEPPVVEA